jgi:hypothetical protein
MMMLRERCCDDDFDEDGHVKVNAKMILVMEMTMMI